MKASIGSLSHGCRTSCPACSFSGQHLNYQVRKIPVNSVRLHHSQASAKAVPVGDLVLYHCQRCSFIWNAGFDPAKLDYSGGYEATQSFSATYRQFLKNQATAFVRDHNLYQRTLVEIGCGNGEFLAAVCEAGENTGIGFDPAFQSHRADPVEKGRYVIHAEKFSNETSLDGVDVIFCRNTLEHIDEVKLFVATIRDAIGDRPGIKVVFQVPAWERISRVSAFWDIYYEHCSYFTAESLRSLFVSTGFSVSSVETVFGEQYLLLVAEAVQDRNALWNPVNAKPGSAETIAKTGQALLDEQNLWKRRIQSWQASQGPVVFWGGGSKAVAFLSAVGNCDACVGAVDINPHKHGTYLPATGLPVIAPGNLRDIQPQKIIVMNRIYMNEIAQELRTLGVNGDMECLG